MASLIQNYAFEFLEWHFCFPIKGELGNIIEFVHITSKN